MQRSRLGLVHLTVFLDLLGFGLILPALPFYAERFGGGLSVGALLASYSLAQLVSAPLLGRLSDRVGRRPVLLVALAGSVVSFTLLGLADGYALLLLARTLAGFAGGSIATAQACIADVTAPADRSRAMGRLGASIGLGFVFGPALGAALSGYGFGAAAFVAAGLAAVNLVGAYFLLPETRPVRTTSVVRRASWRLLGEAVRKPVLLPLLGATFLLMAAIVAMETTYALLGERLFALTPKGMGFVFTFVGLTMAAVQGGLAGRLQKRFGERSLVVAGAALVAVAMLALPHLASFGDSLVALGLLAVGQGLANPNLSSLVSRSAGADEQGGVLGLSQSLSAAARASAPLLAGALFDVGPVWPYLLGAMSAAAAGLLLVATRAALATPDRAATPAGA